jgi:hypothetical protein
VSEVIDLPTQATVDTAWKRLCMLHMQAVDHPHLRDDPEHRHKRKDAGIKFQLLFTKWCGQ